MKSQAEPSGFKFKLHGWQIAYILVFAVLGVVDSIHTVTKFALAFQKGWQTERVELVCKGVDCEKLYKLEDER